MKTVRVVMMMVCAIWLALGWGEAHAQATRTWVSGVGDDANPCSRTAPCKTFAGAISKTAAGGEINTLDPGGYGAVTITKSIRIVAESGVAGVLVSGTNGIVVAAAAADSVYLEGLVFDGVAAAGLNGILFNSGGSLVVYNCKIFGFSQWGILFTPTTPGKLLVSNSLVTNNGSSATFGGVKVFGRAGATTVSGVIDRSLLANNANGFLIDGTGGGGTAEVTVRDSVVTGNTGNGIATNSAGVVSSVVFVDRTTSSHNAGAGIAATGVAQAAAILASSSVQNNGTGLLATGGQIGSFKNNNISSNTTDGAPTVILPQN
ncbi:right-handed parallel beta-helix repeat-containing protein [Bradyrhizobium ontarionense]|uniref:Right-handed parallel beta-helix repeat-containing protein n=1 Tax=Bradyrhizobium ontarionense TaxID=2898149 RepID=A0ABY3R4Y2_9BRAD|nr:right-handed parallel beta-helix repeat-containing protein [Bradyrhizobium sp. A19]UFZ01886.1 right-handed parallel beta-helix repeat-containing protein [Bradyrhizobium sp. A19]